MNLAQYRLLLDFGLAVLIWIVQLVVYPSFLFYRREDLLNWHGDYTQKITCVVLPLMLGQLLAGGLQLWRSVSWYTAFSAVVILSLWLLTFLVFVPLHGQIASGAFDEQTLSRLVQWNWLRTALWTLLFVAGLVASRS
jgi:hypothetical protein